MFVLVCVSVIDGVILDILVDVIIVSSSFCLLLKLSSPVNKEHKLFQNDFVLLPSQLFKSYHFETVSISLYLVKSICNGVTETKLFEIA